MISFLIIWLLLEIILRFVTIVRPIPSYQELHNIWRNSNLFSQQSWTDKYFHEFKLSSSQSYQQYIGWRRNSFIGQYINIDINGVRKTWNPENYDRDPELIYIFGGSTMWGSGSRDDFTIPSCLAKKLDSLGFKIEVINYAETGYIFFQEVVYLIHLLKEGHRPDYVIFYDGVNDVYAAYQYGQAGSIQNLTYIRELLKSKTGLDNFKKFLFDLITFKFSIINQILTNVFYLIEPLDIQYREKAADYTISELEILGDNIIEDYSATLLFLDRLAEIYAFKCFCFWQPVIFTENIKYDNEIRYDLRIDDQKLNFLYLYVNKKTSIIGSDNFYNISNSLHNRDKPYYIDFCHLSEDGNEEIAERILSIIITELNHYK